MLMDNLIEEAERQLTICNACRYCEGYCPVFPALEMRHGITKGDVVLLANLCHDCRACYYACMYTPPHEFNINIPQVLSQVRLESYRDWTWPSILGRAFIDRRIGNAMAAIATVLAVGLSIIFVGPRQLFAIHRGPGAFYAVIPFIVMVLPAFALVFYSSVVWANGGVRFWNDTRSANAGQSDMQALKSALVDVLSLRWLKGGGPGCYYPGAKPSWVRRLFHSFVFYGFLSALVSTCLAAIYQEFFHRIPPYSFTSFPVLFGSIGGVAMIVGVGGLMVIKSKSDPHPADSGAQKLDYSFLIILGLSSLSGLLTLILRTTSAMGILLTIHLGLVGALFISAPYGKFIHALYRSLALISHRVSVHRASQTPSKVLAAGSDKAVTPSAGIGL